MIETEIGKIETEKLNNLLSKYLGETLIVRHPLYWISKGSLVILKEVKVSCNNHCYGCEFIFYTFEKNKIISSYTFSKPSSYKPDNFANFIKSQFLFLVSDKKKTRTIGTRYQEILEKRNKEKEQNNA